MLYREVDIFNVETGLVIPTTEIVCAVVGGFKSSSYIHLNLNTNEGKSKYKYMVLFPRVSLI